MSQPLLSVSNLSIDFKTAQGQVEALRDISFQVQAGESLGIVGESGSGKSVTSLALFDLLATNAVIKSGRVVFQGRDLFAMSAAEKQKLRGREMAMIFQDPMTALNPCFTVEQQIGEVLEIHLGLSKSARREKVTELLGQVGIQNPSERLSAYPHELSGGMSQRVMIAMAMACRPKLIVADEPTTALDVTIQKQILDLLKQLRVKHQMAMILVSHDLGVIAAHTDRMLVMYAGEIVEQGKAQEVIQNPLHPYTEGLLKCLPSKHVKTSEDFRLPTIRGLVPSLFQRPQGCQLAPRCDYKKDGCESSTIFLSSRGDREVRCLYPLESKS
jgi:oligopeptide/dipeptide ABC transporter ATP-binding protein